MKGITQLSIGKLIIMLGLFSFVLPVEAQIQSIADKVLSVDVNKGTTPEQIAELSEFWELIKFLREEEQREKSLNGSIEFGFLGNTSDINSLYQINGGVTMDNGSYPFEFDFSTNLQTVLRQGEFSESISDVDISFDYSHSSIGNGLVIENYVFMSRFSDAYLGIDQKYEIGGGFTINHWAKVLTSLGQNKKKRIDNHPKYQLEGKNLIKCYQDVCMIIDNPSLLTEEEITMIANQATQFERINRKRYSKLRLSMLIGIAYELEKARAINMANITGVEETLSLDFPTVNQLIWEARPTFKWRPSDVFVIKIYPYVKVPVKNYRNVVSGFGLTDERFDYNIDLQSSITANFNERTSISFTYRYLYDNAPRRRFIENVNGDVFLFSGQQFHSSSALSFGYKL